MNNDRFVIMRLLIFFVLLVSSRITWEHFQCVNFMNNPQQCTNANQAREHILRNHFFANSSPTAAYFSPIVFPLKTITNGPDFVQRLFNFVNTYCNFNRHDDQEACMYVCPTPVGTLPDGITPVRAIRININLDAPNFRMSTAFPLRHGLAVRSEDTII